MRKRKAFLGVGLACALLLTMLAGCGAQESSAAPTSEASVKTEQTESQSGNVFTNPDVSIGEGTITVLTNVTEGNRLKELEKYAQEFDAKYPGTQKVEFEAIDDYENQTKIRLSGSDYGDVLLIPNTVDVENLDEYFVPLGKYNLNYSVGKVRWRPWAERGGRIATNTTTFNREILIVEKANDGKPFELHTSYDDKEKYYRNLRNPWLFLLLMFALFAVTKQSIIFGIFALVSVIPGSIYQIQIMKIRKEAKTQEW